MKSLPAALLTALFALFAATAADAQTRPFIVTGVSASFADNGNQYFESGSIVFHVKNQSAQSQTMLTSGDCGPFLPTTANGLGLYCAWDASPYSVALAAGASTDVTLAIPLGRETGRMIGDVSVTVWPSGDTSLGTQAVVHVTWDSNVPQLWADLVQTAYTPVMSPRTLAIAADMHNSANIAPASVRNAGNAAAAYVFTAHCSGAVTNCRTSPGTATVQPGGSTSPVVTYSAGAAGSGTIVLVATAPPNMAGVAESDSAVVAVTVSDLYAPVITMTPGGDVVDPAYGLMSPISIQTRERLTVDVCDRDGVVGIFYMYLDNQLVPWESISFPSLPGCYSAIHATFKPPFIAGSNRVVVYASDFVHTPGVDQTYVYDDTFDHVAQVTTARTNPQIGVNQAIVDTFLVKNPGWRSAQYTFSALCTYSTGSPACPTPAVQGTALTIGPGATAAVPVTYQSPSGLATNTIVQLAATLGGTSLSSRGILVATTAPVLPPTIAFSPSNATSVTTPTIDLSITWCDPDDYVMSHSATWEGRPLQTAVIAFTGCRVELWRALPIDPWNQTVTATATDAAGHSTTRSATITYTAPMSAFKPAISPKGGTHRVRPGAAVLDTFVVTNPGQYPVAYSLSASCGGLANCTVTPGAVSLADSAAATVIVGYQSSATRDAPDSIRLVATYTSPLGATIADTAKRAVVAPSVEALPVVTTYVSGLHAIAPGMIELGYYRVTNNGSAQVTYDLSWNLTGGFGTPAWGAPDSLVTLEPGQGKDVYVYVRAPSLDGITGTVSLTASYVSSLGATMTATAASYWIVRSPRPAIAVSPKSTTTIVYRGNVTNQVGFAVTNTGNTPVSVADTVVCGGVAINCRWTPAGQVLGLADVSGVTVSFDLAASGEVGSVKLIARDINDGMVADTAGMTLRTNASYIALEVSPKSARKVANRSRTFPQRFYVRNTGTASGVVSLAPSCDAAITCGLPQPAALALAPGQRDSTTISITSPSQDGTEGHARLIASVGAVADTGDIVIAAAAVSDIAVSVRNTTGGSTIARNACLAIAVSESAAYECGDLRVAHALPATTTMNRLRAPTLTYVSRQVTGVVLFPMDVTVVPGNGVTSIVAYLSIGGGAPLDSVTLPWDDSWSGAGARRVVVPLHVVAQNIQTGAYDYTASVTARSATSAIQGSDAGTVAIVNRHDSPFGAGWWLDGLEQLVPAGAHQMLWIGGNGNTRLYTQVGTSNVWLVKPAVDRPDSLVAVGSSWRRALGDSAYVEFDNRGRHLLTRNVQGYATIFTYADSAHPRLLTSIDLPVPAGALPRTYIFRYDAQQRLVGVDAPAATAARHTTVEPIPVDGSWTIHSIADPDSVGTVFVYNADGSMRSRVNRANYSVSFTYDEGRALSSATVDMAGTAPEAIVRRFCAAETASLTACAPGLRDTAELWTIYDGPRSVSDTTRFALDRFGAPRQIIDALGHRTTIERADTHWPALATRVVDPRGHETRTEYDSLRALPVRSIDVNPNAVNRTDADAPAITEYKWHPRWNSVTRVTDAAGVVSGFEYDSVTGDRSAQYTSDSRLRLVRYEYDPATRQVIRVYTPQSESPSVYEYDALGNLSATSTPMGVRSTFGRDRIGRDTLDSDAIQGVWRHFRRFSYDALDRVRQTADSAPTSPSDPTPQLLTVVNDYDAVGNLRNVVRTQSPDPLSIGSMQLRSEFDAAGRKMAEYDPDRMSAADGRRWAYDAAGNVTKSWRDGDSVTTDYDVLNRPIHRIVGRLPSLGAEPWNDEQTLDYDASGHLVSANNRYARIGRTYTLGGRLLNDSTQIATEGGAFDGHRFVTSYRYDAAGRRTLFTPPQILGVLDPVTYEYDDRTGDLFAVAVQSGWNERFSYFYTQAGMLDSLTRPGGMSEQHRYDDDGRELSRTDRGGAAGAIHDESMQRDDRGKLLWISTPGSGHAPSETFVYDGMGGAVSTSGSTVEATPRDPLGNVVRHDFVGATYSESYRYETHSTRLRTIAQQVNDRGWVDSVTQIYSLAGDLARRNERVMGPQMCVVQTGLTDCPQSTPFRVIAYSNLSNAYDANGRLVRSIKETSNDDSWSWPDASVRDPNGHELYPKFERGVTEEYRYDALGRRIWVKAHRDPYCQGPRDRDSTSVCLSTVERTIYDGDQVLAEIRQPAEDTVPAWIQESDVPVRVSPAQHFGVIGYVQGPVLDQPLELIRNISGDAVRLIPHYQWRGALDVATTLDGNYVQCGLPGVTGSCEDIEWAGARMTFGMVIPHRTLGPASWWGTLVDAKQNATGMLDMRNRQYDPRSGRFTQEDPIGLAGGMNLYGFAGGDPVNYDDPHGLCPACAAAAVFEFGLGAQVVPGVGQVVGGIAIAASAAISGYALYKLYNEKAGDGRSGGESAGRRASKAERQAARDRNRASNKDGELRCVHCGEETVETPGQPNSSQIDHIQPRNPNDGGPRGNNEPDNLKNSCRTCNLDKSNKRPPYTPPLNPRR